ncbi:transposable element Tc3 transposase [Clonorchis sinensis]|uniref:Transposable element Tc3 transposase n=1 Tax=Clonorchis sinensis TaxID=79923 RepID=G7YPR7_CLOSI|nr:transposable element Tc3 transposase [Clonorchis sinensis]
MGLNRRRRGRGYGGACIECLMINAKFDWSHKGGFECKCEHFCLQWTLVTTRIEILKLYYSFGESATAALRTLLQNITEEDKEQRVTFANWLLDNEEIVLNILWSDEANFSVDGIINKHNCVIWSREAPHEYFTHNLHFPHLCVWMGFSSKCLLRPFFFDATVSGDSYLHMLQTHVIPQLKQHKKSSTVFQQDGAPPHYSNQVRTYLREQFSDERVIARGFPNFWPTRSPDPTPLDYRFWGLIKARVYHEK